MEHGRLASVATSPLRSQCPSEQLPPSNPGLLTRVFIRSTGHRRSRRLLRLPPDNNVQQGSEEREPLWLPDRPSVQDRSLGPLNYHAPVGSTLSEDSVSTVRRPGSVLGCPNGEEKRGSEPNGTTELHQRSAEPRLNVWTTCPAETAPAQKSAAASDSLHRR